MAKIVIVGAGSHIFAKDFITDVLFHPELRNSTITLMDIAQEPLDLITAFAKKMVTQHGFKTKIESTTNRREALEGADYVLCTIRAGGARPSEIDRAITKKHGVQWDDTMGAAGVFYGLRNMQVVLDICHDMEKYCPDAWFINYANPNAMNSWAANTYSHIKSIGLCPNSESGARRLARDAGVPFEETAWFCAGINHFSWYLEFKWHGEDAYPRLREKYKGDVFSWSDSALKNVDLVEVEMFKRFGYFTNGGAGHISFFLPYFMSKPEIMKKYRRTWYDADGAAKQRVVEDKIFTQQIYGDYKFPINDENRWSVFAANAIHSMETGTARRISCNVKNTGIITNLPEGCCVEVPCLVDKEGVHPCYVGDLPPQCAAPVRLSVNVQELAVQGTVEKNKNKIFQAIMLDPLTGAILSIDEIQDLVEELFQANKEYLKGFK